MKSIIKKIGKVLYKWTYDYPDHKGLRLLSIFKLDIYFLPLFWFFLQNRRLLPTYLKIRLKGQKPKIVFVTVEGDGRFKKLLELSREKISEYFFFELPIMSFATELRFFSKHNLEFCKKTKNNERYVDVFACYYDANNIENRKKYAIVAGKILSVFQFFFDIKMIISGSGADHYAVELIRIARKRKIKWTICEREGSHSEISGKALGNLFYSTNPLVVDCVITTNPIHEDCFRIACGNSPETQVIKLGEVRSDKWVTAKYAFDRIEYASWNKFQKKILFLVFGDRSYIEPMDHPHISGNWIALLHDIEDVLFEHAQNNPDHLIFYKMGHREDHNKAFLDRVAQASLKNVVPLERVFPCEELIQYCDLIIGFQSTATIESMFTTKPIIYPFWNFPIEVDPDKDVLPIHRMEATEVARSKDELASALSTWSKTGLQVSEEKLANRKKWREFYFHQPDGNASKRALNQIYSMLDN